MLGIDT